MINQIKPIPLLIGLVVVGLSVVTALPPSKKTTTTAPAPTGSSQTKVKTYLLSEVAQHGDQSSCWTTINGNVYDLTAWIAQHPGGEGAILSVCGKDGSEAFNGQHGGQPQPEQTLATFKIGILAN